MARESQSGIRATTIYIKTRHGREAECELARPSRSHGCGQTSHQTSDSTINPTGFHGRPDQPTDVTDAGRVKDLLPDRSSLIKLRRSSAVKLVVTNDSPGL